MQTNQPTISNESDKIVLLAVSFFLLALSYLNLNTNFLLRLDEGTTNTSYSNYYYLILLVCFFVYAFFHPNKNLLIFFWALWGYFVFVYLFSTSVTFDNLFSAFVFTLFAFCYRFGRRLANTNKMNVLRFLKLILFFVIIPLSVYCIYLFFSTNLFTNQGATDAYFFIMAYFPFVLMINEKRTLKIILYLVFLVLAVISLKRSIILGFVACSFLYAINSYHKKLFSSWQFWLLLIALVVLGYWFYGFVSETLFYRFSSLEEDRGTGRDILYNQVFSAIRQSDGFQLLFGHGFQAVRLITSSHKMAHNDLLEILYDFGIIGFISYLFFLLSLIRVAFKKRKKDNVNKTIYPAYVGSLVFFIFLSFFNCMIYSPMIVSPIMLSLGILREALDHNQL